MKKRKEDYKKLLEQAEEEIFKMKVENNKLKNRSKVDSFLVQDSKCDKRIHIIQFEEEIKRLQLQL